MHNSDYAKYHCLGFTPNEEKSSLKEDLYRKNYGGKSLQKKEVFQVFYVVSKKTGITYKVYGVSGSQFLIFFNNSFGWFNMIDFRPTEKTEEERMNEEAKRVSPMFKSQQPKKPMYP